MQRLNSFVTEDSTPLVKFGLAFLPFVAISLAALLLPYAGVQNDEVLFSQPLYFRVDQTMQIPVFHHDVPLMVMSYVGALKTWIYSAVFSIVKPSIASLRWPVVLMCALTIWICGKLLTRVAGAAAGLCCAALLATDPSFLLTSVFDWGPVVLQHLCTAATLFLFLRFHRTRSLAALFAAFLFLGLGMWDKALFAWVLGGLALSAVAFFHREIRNHLTWKNVAIALAGALVGSLPLVVYNARNQLVTFRTNAVLSTEGFSGKAGALRSTLDGSALLGYLVNENWVDPVRNPSSAIERALVNLQERLGPSRTTMLPWGIAASILAFPLWYRRWRAMLFPLVTGVIAWLQMALTKDAGGAAHHAILIWPMPVWIVAIAIGGLATGAAWRRWAAVIVLLLLCWGNLRVINEYYTRFVRNGAGPLWSDANTRLMYAKLPGNDVLVMDWGMLHSLRMFHEGRVNVWSGVEPVADDNVTPVDRQEITRMLQIPSAVFVAHTPAFEVQRGVAERLTTVAREFGYTRSNIETIWDRNGRPVFEIYRFTRH